MSMLSWLQLNSGKSYGNFINGEWVTAENGELLPLYHAARTDEVLGYFPDSSESDVDRAVESAHAAFLAMPSLTPYDRSAILLRFVELLERDTEEIAYRLSAEQGKTLAEARGEVGRAAKEARFSAGEALRVGGETLPGERGGVINATYSEAIGVVAAIAPWNFPIVTPVRKIAPAFAYGCTVVFKPASATPWASVKLMELFHEAGVPKGAINMVIGSGSKVGQALVTHPLVKGVSFTGSTLQGIRIQEQAARRLAKTQLELGGKNAALVIDYGNLAFAAKAIASAAFACSGQRCTAISRVIVLRRQAEELKTALLHEISQIRIGPAWEPQAAMGPLINQEQYDAISGYIRLGEEEGARLLAGGERLTEGELAQGYFMTPVLFDHVTPEMRIAKEEIFGPVLCVIEVLDEEEAIKAANSTDYGLAASIFTDNISLAHRAAEKLEVGMVHINHGTASAPHMPFGGVKSSGFGPYSIGSSNRDFFTNTKTVYLQY